MNNRKEVASVIFAAGKGSRMEGYEGNKTLLPLVPESSPYEGRHPLIIEVLRNLPPGPIGIVVHHFAEAVESATENEHPTYIPQPETNGTGGALLVSKPFLQSVEQDCVIITMGDVPLIRAATYRKLVNQLTFNHMMLLAFEPQDRAQYGVIETEGDRAVRIVEWKYWKDYPANKQAKLRFCNAGVYAVRRDVLLKYMDRLEKQPHRVAKQRGDVWVTIEEYFLTDIVELMSHDNLAVSVVAVPEEEVIGVDTPDALKRVQELYSQSL